METAYQSIETLKVDQILAVADAIEKRDIENVGFDMESIYDMSVTGMDPAGHVCGSVACIAGWTLLINGKRDRVIGLVYATELMDEAAELLGLRSDRMREALFVPDGFDENQITDKQAVRTLRHLAATGKVDFEVAF